MPIVARYYSAGEPYPARPDIAEALSLVAQGLRRPILWTEPPDHHEVTLDIRWVATAADLPDPTGVDVVGEGGPSIENGEIVSGQVWLVAGVQLAHGRSPDSTESLSVHEAGHALLGFAHSTNQSDAMYPVLSLTRPPGFSPAESAAAAWVGGATCAGGLPRPIAPSS